jgi:uncharacterized protein (TIGR03083 family)
VLARNPARGGKARVAGGTVVLVISGGNLSQEKLRAALESTVRLMLPTPNKKELDSGMTFKPDKNSLMGQLRSERDRIEGLLAGLSDEQMEIPIAENGWAVKDVIAHLTVWESRGMQWIEWGVAAHHTGEPVPQAGYSVQDVDRLNAETYQQNRDRPPQEILKEFRRSFPLLMKQVQALNDSDLEKVVQADWTGNRPATIGEIVAWRYFHRREHGHQIEAWVNRLRIGAGG